MLIIIIIITIIINEWVYIKHVNCTSTIHLIPDMLYSTVGKIKSENDFIDAFYEIRVHNMCYISVMYAFYFSLFI